MWGGYQGLKEIEHEFIFKLYLKLNTYKIYIQKEKFQICCQITGGRISDHLCIKTFFLDVTVTRGRYKS